MSLTQDANGVPYVNATGAIAVAIAAFARPADVIAYSALDAVSGSISAPVPMTFANLARIAGGSGYIVKARLVTDQSSCTARFRLHLYHTAPAATNDNSPFGELYTVRASKIGYIDFDAATTEGSGSTAAGALNSAARLAFLCAASSRDIVGILETRDGFTPASAQNFHVELTAEIY